jgi:hypothetical protein
VSDFRVGDRVRQEGVVTEVNGVGIVVEVTTPGDDPSVSRSSWTKTFATLVQRAPLKVGDILDPATDPKPEDGVVLLDFDGTAWQCDGTAWQWDGTAWQCDGTGPRNLNGWSPYAWGDLAEHGPFTVLYVPPAVTE